MRISSVWLSKRKSRLAAIGCWLALILFVAVAPGMAQSSVSDAVVLLRVTGVIDPVVAGYVEQGVQTATEEGARLVVIQLDTPGGLDTAMRTIVQTIMNAKVPVVVYVAPSGARAASAGVFITAAAHVAAMAPGTNIGAARPVDIGQGEMPETMADKVTNDAVAYLAAIAEQRNRNVSLAERLVRESQSLTAQQALEERLIDLIAVDLKALLAALEGRTVEVAGVQITLHTAGVPIVERNMNWLQVITHGIVDPNIAYVLLSLGTIALVAEFWNPGAIIPGVVGAICLVLAFVAFGSLPVNYGGVALIILAIIFFVLDLMVAGFGLTIAGVIAFIIGSLFLFSPFTPPEPSMPQLSVSPWLLIGMTAMLVLFFTTVLAAGVRAQLRPSAMRINLPVGSTGIAVSDLKPQGVIQAAGEQWTAIVVEGDVHAGDEVVVVGHEGLRVKVRRQQATSGARDERSETA
ncbi:MAG: serine protease [Ardenticatenia bacterium]|nr:MAG: serine protease [Ardenticatenia bacterium]